MINFKVNEEEIALLNAYRLLTTRQRAMIFSAAVGVTRMVAPLKLVGTNVTPLRAASSSKLACNS